MLMKNYPQQQILKRKRNKEENLGHNGLFLNLNKIMNRVCSHHVHQLGGNQITVSADQSDI